MQLFVALCASCFDWQLHDTISAHATSEPTHMQAAAPAAPAATKPAKPTPAKAAAQVG